MRSRATRRDALKQISPPALGWSPIVLRGQPTPITIAGQPVEIAVASISPATVRITITGATAGASVRDDARRRPRTNAAPRGVRSDQGGEPDGPLLRESAGTHRRNGAGQSVQQITLDAATPTVRFSLGKGPPRLRRRWPAVRSQGLDLHNRNGQGGYQLRIGGRVPIQWLVSTDGWGLFIHHPLGEFDLTGATGMLTPSTDALPIDLFVSASPDPKTLLAEYARVTGFAELPPRWAFGRHAIAPHARRAG